MNGISLSHLVSRGSGAVAVEADGEIVMLGVDKGAYYSLSGTGRAIWLALEQPRTVEEVVDQLAREYDVEREALEHDVLEFLSDMISERLVSMEERAQA